MNNYMTYRIMKKMHLDKGGGGQVILILLGGGGVIQNFDDGSNFSRHHTPLPPDT